MDAWSLFKRGRPAWLTSLPSHEAPGVFAFLVAIIRAQALTFGTLFALFPVFRMNHPDGFRFSAAEGFFFALLYAFFEDHARWNYVVNATRPFIAATRFAVLIVLLEQLLFYFSPSADVGFLELAVARVPVAGLHFALSFMAAACARRDQYFMSGVFVVGLFAHAGFNFLGVAGWVGTSL